MEVEDAWIKYSEMDTSKYTGLITLFSTITSLFTHPLNVITTRQQAVALTSGTPSTSRNIVRAIRQSYGEIGLKGLFRGWGAITAMGMPSQVIYLHTTEVSREYLQQKLHAHFPDAPAAGIDIMQTTLSSIIANVLSNIPYVPAEVISNRLIVQGRDGLGTVAMTKKIYRDNGLMGFYRGFGASLSLGILLSAEWWFCYSVFRREASKWQIMKDYPIFFDAVSGLVAGQITTVTLHPLDTMKTLIMTSDKSSNSATSSIWRRAREAVDKQGIRTLWRGLGASMYHSAFSCTGFAIIYEVIKKTSVENQKGSGGNSCRP